MNSKTKILVTGGSGFIGTNVVNYFVKHGYEVMNIDKKEPMNKQLFAYWNKVNIVQLESFERAVINFSPDYIIHLAAKCDLEGKTLEDYQANTIGVENLLKICQNSSLSLKKVLITSSMLVCKSGYEYTSQRDYSPHTIYGESKVKTEQLTWANPPSCDWCILRPTSIWGEWFEEPYKNFFDLIINRRYFHIGHNSATMTYGYIGNTVKQIEAILFTDTIKCQNKVYYLGDYEATNLETWANEIAKELNIKIFRIPYGILKTAAILGDILEKLNVKFLLTSFRLTNMTTNHIIDLSQTEQLLKDLPYSRREGIHNTLLWLKRNRK